MKDRIKQIMESQKMSQQEFAQTLGISAASLSSIFTGRTNPTNNHTQAIHRAFPDVNINWLIFGEGEMYNSPVPPLEADKLAQNDLPFSEYQAPLTGQNVSPLGVDNDMIVMAPTSPGIVSNTYDSRSRNVNRESQKLTKVIEKPVRAVKEIRVFYDDGTYESFVPSK